MSQKHSPEPWKVEPEPKDYRVTIESQGVVVLDCLGHQDKETDIANAARIVACINFCGGVEIETLTLLNQSGVPTLKQWCEENQALREQVKEREVEIARVKEYTTHWDVCELNLSKSFPHCTCGLAELLEKGNK